MAPSTTVPLSEASAPSQTTGLFASLFSSRPSAAAATHFGSPAAPAPATNGAPSPARKGAPATATRRDSTKNYRPLRDDLVRDSSWSTPTSDRGGSGSGSGAGAGDGNTFFPQMSPPPGPPSATSSTGSAYFTPEGRRASMAPQPTAGRESSMSAGGGGVSSNGGASGFVSSYSYPSNATGGAAADPGSASSSGFRFTFGSPSSGGRAAGAAADTPAVTTTTMGRVGAAAGGGGDGSGQGIAGSPPKFAFGARGNIRGAGRSEDEDNAAQAFMQQHRGHQRQHGGSEVRALVGCGRWEVMYTTRCLFFPCGVVVGLQRGGICSRLSIPVMRLWIGCFDFVLRV